MKKHLTLIVLLVSLCGYANAQTYLGIKGGVNFANVSGEGIDVDGKTGFHFGSFAEINMENFAIQPEILFSTGGAEDFDLTYLAIPILFKKNFAEIFNIHLGPQFAILTSAEAFSVDIKESLKSLDLGIAAGAGVNLSSGLVIGGRYIYGLSDINDTLGGEIKNKTLQVYVGWKFSN